MLNDRPTPNAPASYRKVGSATWNAPYLAAIVIFWL